MAEQEPQQEELLRRIARLEKEVARLARLSRRPITVQQLHVRQLHVDALQLDQPVYRLDSLTVRELSGSLNLGNNFATVPAFRKPPEEEGPPAGADGPVGAGGPAGAERPAGAKGPAGAGGPGEAAAGGSRADSGEGALSAELLRERAQGSAIGRAGHRRAQVLKRTGPGIRYTIE